MSMEPGGVLRLPEDSIPDGCPLWDGAQAGRWVRALPSGWVPLRVGFGGVVALPLVAVAGAAVTGERGLLPGWLAALVWLHAVWVWGRPEAVLVGAPVGAVAVGAVGGRPAWQVGVAAVLVGVWGAAILRVRARRAQRGAGLAATGGFTAVLPEVEGGRSGRGGFLFGFGLVVVVVGGAVLGLAVGGDRGTGPAVGWTVGGLGLTLVLSGVLTRRRAAALRRAPVPALRVLLGEGPDGDTEVLAADDTGAARPLFSVATRTAGADDDADTDDSNDTDDSHDSDDGDDGDGSLREGVLYGVPYDGGEVVLVVAGGGGIGAAAGVEVGVGPVRPLSDWGVRRRASEERREAAREACYAKRGRSAAEMVAAEGRGDAVKVRRWRAGWVDLCAVLILVLWGFWIANDSGWWRYVGGVGLSLLAAALLPRRLAWRVTADRDGLWFNGLREARQLLWDDVREVRCRGIALEIGSRRESFDEWWVAGPRWPWLERRLGVLHPYERTAAEITAMWREPELRPVGVSGVRQRGRALWPLGVVIGVVGMVAVFLLP